MSLMYAFILVATATMSGAQATASTTGSSPAFSISISVAQTTVKSSSPVMLTTKLSNISDHKVGFPWRSEAGWNYEWIVLDGQGNPAETVPTHRVDRYGRHQVKVRTGTGAQVVLEPGQSRTDQFNVCDFKDISKAGAYTIQLERIDPNSNSVVKSNILTITVTP